MNKDDGIGTVIVLGFGFVLLILIWSYYNFVSPNIYIWQAGKAGQAELAQAEYNRQIATCEAQAKKESARALADAEVIRAEGVAKANKIIGDSLTGNEGYLRYLWIQGLQTNNMQVVYVPTEANLPILESTRIKR
jgi:regulator of protease activity HflC (stomatin/prohibitin superfamily)